MKNRLYVVFVFCLVLVLLASCGQPAANVPVEEEAAPAEETVATEAEEPATGGELSFSLATDQLILDPNLTTYNVDIIVHNNIYRQLYRVNEDASGLEPFAAESYEVNDDATIWTFKLRDDIKFSDGTPITAEDVVYSIERAMVPEACWVWIFEEAGLVPRRTPVHD